jgi:integrase/recombinase XerD
MGESVDYCAQFETYLLTEKRFSQNTFLSYRRDLLQFGAFLKNKRVLIPACTKDHLRAYLKYLKDQGLTAKSIARKISTLKHFFSFLHERYHIDNSARSLVFPKLEKTLPRYLSEQEVQQLLAAANRDTSDKGFRNKVMLYLLYATGMRVSELVSLTLDKIVFDTGFVHIMGKGKKERAVPLPKNILELLSHYTQVIYPRLLPPSYHKEGMTQYLFATVQKGELKPISRQLFWLSLKKILKCAAIFKDVSPHSLRHSLATHLLKNGADIRSLQMLLGHESLATVQIYTHLGNQDIRRIYDKKHPRA